MIHNHPKKYFTSSKKSNGSTKNRNYFALWNYFTLRCHHLDILAISKENGKDEGLQINFKHGISLIPSVLLAYYPRTILELILWLLTIFCLYVRFGKEPTPLIRYFKAMYNFQGKQEGRPSLRLKYQFLPSTVYWLHFP